MPASLNVLVVDDERKIRDILEQILTARGCTVRKAEDGLDGLTQFKQQPADIVITDIKMPKLNGLELLRELKRLDPLVNIVVITAYPSLDGAVEAMKVGACDFVTKPFDIAKIQAILVRCQQRVSLIRQLHQAGEGMLKLEELNRRLTELNDMKSQFLATLSHEINTPLCLMSEWIYLLSDETLGTLSEDQQHALDVVNGAYGRLHRLLQQLVDLMHGSEIILQRGPYDLRELVREAVGNVTPKAVARHVTVGCHVPEAPVKVEVDRSRTIRTVEYLVDNAIKFNTDGGRVDVTVTLARDGVEIHVRDTGMGIESSEQERIFQSFYQVDHRLNRAYEGAGIGLSLARRYVELHGGSMTLSSQPGKGTNVVVWLPGISAHVELIRDAS